MKHFFLSGVIGLVLCLFHPALAQEPVPGETSHAFRTEMNRIFQGVDPTPVTTGLLWDYGMELTDVVKFNGVLSTSNYLNLAEWQRLYATMYTMKFNNNISLTTPFGVQGQVEYYGTQSTAHNIVAQHMRYQKFRSDATSRGVSTANNKLTCGNTTAPYEIRDVFAATLNHLHLEGGSHKFIFRSALFYNKSGKTVSLIQADFGDGQGYRTISLNAEVAVNYASEGTKTFKLKIKYTDNSTYESWGKLYVSNIVNTNNSRYNSSNIRTVVFPVSGFPSPLVYKSKVAGATVTIEYAGTNQILDKPLIVIEGYDGWKLLSPDDPTRNFDFEDFIDGTRGGGISIEINRSTHQTLNDLIEQDGYDLVFVDFNDGVDYIQRNAYLVENIIQWVNAQKAQYSTKQKNVVMGMSMGGLIARYALRDMEKRNLAHDAQLYISHDAPHQGANVPLSAQVAIRHLAGTRIGLGFGIYYTVTLGEMNHKLGNVGKLLDAPATRQLVQYWAAPYITTLGVDNSLHDSFMTEYRTLGYPTQTRNVALASGSECATQQAFGPYAELLNVDDGFSLNYWQGLLASVASVFTTYPQLFIGSVVTTKTDIRANFTLNALPDKQVQRIYRGKLYVSKKILFAINVNLTITDKALNSASYMLPLDNAPGGIYDIENFDVPTDVAGIPLNFKQKRFNFVPVTSSLDVGRGSQTITTADLLKAYSPSSPPPAPKDIPFANFFTSPVRNEGHIDFTLNNGRWVFDEMKARNPRYNCSQFCSAVPSITGGADYVCYSGNTTFSLSNASGLTTQWRVSGNLSIVSRTNTGITVRAASATATGGGWIEATVNTSAGCQAEVARRNISVGVISTSDIRISGPSAVCPGTEYTYTASPSGPGYTYTWTYPGDWASGGQSGNRIYLYSSSYSSEIGTVRVSINNGCGASGYSGITVYPVDCGNTTSAFVVYPNPADDQINIEPAPETDVLAIDSSVQADITVRFATEVTTISHEAEAFNVVLYNEQQEIVTTATSVNQSISLDASALPAGTYYLHIYYKDAIEQKKVIVE